MRRRARWLAPLAITALAITAATAGGGCEGRPKRAAQGASHDAIASGPAVVEIDLSGGDPEQASRTLFGPARQRTHLELVESLGDLAGDADAKGVLVRLGTADDIGFARAHEVGRLLGAVRAAGKPIVCHADAYTHSALLLASLGCDRLWVSPAGEVDAVGIGMELVFAKRLLDKLDVDVDFLQVGKYKGASEPFTRESASPEARASLERALGGIRAAWARGIVEGRGDEALVDVIEDGPFAAEEAKARGLVDEVGYLGDARDDALERAGATHTVARFGGKPPASSGILDVFRAIADTDESGTPHVAVVRAVGSIAMGVSTSLLGDGEGIGERELGGLLARLADDDAAKAVVVRIDSPGGSALASDLLWKRLMLLRAKKPLVFSVGGMAASGGYYMACTATKIVAEPTSIVGSIGVVGGKFGVGRTLDALGVDVESVSASPDPVRAARSTYMSPFLAWDDPTRERMLASMTAIYDLFLRRAAEGRGVPVERIAVSAEGQLFGGVEAKERGLVDEVGGLADALRIARELAALPEDAPIEAVGQPGGLLDLLGGSDDASDTELEAGARVQRSAAAAILPKWAALPPELRVLVGSAMPLLQGERTVAALPFAILVR